MSDYTDDSYNAELQDINTTLDEIRGLLQEANKGATAPCHCCGRCPHCGHVPYPHYPYIYPFWYDQPFVYTPAPYGTGYPITVTC